MSAAPLPWWHDCGEIARLIRWLDDTGETVNYGAADYARIVAKPWNWTAEYERMMREQARTPKGG